MTCRLICVDPAQAAEFWPFVASLIERACKRGLYDYAGAERSVLAGTALLWLAWNGEIAAAATTELHKINGRKLCFIAALGGTNRGRWLHLIGGIEDFARAEGCEATVIMGRPGWKRVLPSYKMRGAIIERML